MTFTQRILKLQIKRTFQTFGYLSGPLKTKTQFYLDFCNITIRWICIMYLLRCDGTKHKRAVAVMYT